MDRHKYYATNGYKIFVIAASLLSFSVSLGSIYFYFLGKAPLWLGAAFFISSIALLARVVVVFRYPVISFDGKIITVRSWFGGIKELDPFSEMDVARGTDGFVIKQDKTGIALVPQEIGKKQFSELLMSVAETGESPLTSLGTIAPAGLDKH